MTNRYPMIAKVGGFIIALILVFAGLLMLRSDALLWGGFTLLVGLGIFIFSVRFIEKHPLEDQQLTLLKSYRWLIISWIISLVLTVWVLYQQSQPENADYDLRWNGVLWIISNFLLVFGAVSVSDWHWLTNRTNFRLWWIKNRSEVFWLTIILLAGLILRIYALELHPYPWSGDEASVGIDARRILRGEIVNLYATSWSSQPNLSFFPTSIALIIFGERIAAIRMVSAVIGTLTIFSTYLLAREFFEQKVALWAAIFLMAFPYHLHFSRIGVSNIFDGLNVTLGLWLTYRAIRYRKILDYVLAGIIAGLSFYTYVGSRLVPVIMLGGFIYAAMREKGYLRSQYPKLMVTLFSAFVTVAPMAAYFIKKPDNFMTRIGQEGILLNGWLSQQAEAGGTSSLSILFNQFSKSILVFISTSAHGNFFNSPDPYLTLLGAIFFMIGMAYVFWSWKEIRSMLLLGWFWSVVLFGSVLTASPPAHQRMVMSIPAIAILLALGMQQFFDTLKNLHIPSNVRKILISTIMLILVLQGIFFYFGEYWSGFYFQDGNSELGMETGLQLQQLGAEYNYYLFGRPRVFAQFPTSTFLAPDNDRYDMIGDEIDSLVIPAEKGAFFVAIPDNLTDLMQIEARFPGGNWSVVERKTKSEILYYAYTLRPADYVRP